MEATLRTLDRELVSRLEAAFVDLRAEIRRGAPEADIARRIEAIGVDLTVAETKLSASASSAFVTFLASALIILREGSRRRSSSPRSSDCCESSAAATPPRRSIMVGFWRSSPASPPGGSRGPRSRSRRGAGAGGGNRGIGRRRDACVHELLDPLARRREALARVRPRPSDERARGAGKATLFGIAFLAVYREAFETVLFYEALMTERGPRRCRPYCWDWPRARRCSSSRSLGSSSFRRGSPCARSSRSRGRSSTRSPSSSRGRGSMRSSRGLPRPAPDPIPNDRVARGLPRFAWCFAPGAVRGGRGIGIGARDARGARRGRRRRFLGLNAAAPAGLNPPSASG